jgi:DNA mismatch repair protein MLH1
VVVPDLVRPSIQREDMPIVCERFTTSKLSTFEDLQSLNTFGFRGEALASISHVAHVTIVSMTKDSPCAYKYARRKFPPRNLNLVLISRVMICFRAHYADGKLVGRDGESPDPKPCAGTVGTTITAEDLFFNVPSRRKAMKSASEEYQRVVEVISKYSLHYSGIAMNVKKHGDNRSDVNTLRETQLKDNIRLLHGAKVFAELLEINVDVPAVDAKVKGFVSEKAISSASPACSNLMGNTISIRFITGPNYSGKKISFILFINNRLVDCAPLKKAVETVYGHMFQKSVHPWIYLSLMFPPHKIDPNVHPTKSEVRFLNQEEVIAEVIAQITSELEKSNMSRAFDTEGGAAWSVIPHHVQTSLHDSMEVDQTPQQTSNVTPEKMNSPQMKPYQHQMIRTDSKSQKLDSFLSPNRSRNGSFSTDTSPVARAINFEETTVATAAQQEEDDGIELFDDPMELDTAPHQCDHGHDHSHDQPLENDRNDFEDDDEEAPPSPTLKKRKRDSPGTDSRPTLGKFSANAEPISSSRQEIDVQPEEFRKRKRLEQRKPEKVRLTSVTNLISAFETASHSGLRDVFSNYAFVGCFDSTRVLLQFETRLFICDMSRLSYVLFLMPISLSPDLW